MKNKGKIVDYEASASAIIGGKKMVKDKEGWYTTGMLEIDINTINDDLKAIRLDRGRRYGGQEDTLRNVRECDPEGAWRGAYVSAVECINRLKNIFMTPCAEQSVEDFENMTDDLINYAYYIKILGRQKFNGGV